MEPMRVREGARGPGLVPELLVETLEDSLDFWCRICGFQVVYDRPEEGFASIAPGTAPASRRECSVRRNKPCSVGSNLPRVVRRAVRNPVGAHRHRGELQSGPPTRPLAHGNCSDRVAEVAPLVRSAREQCVD